MSIDLDAYFRRIGYAGGTRPRLDTLAAIHLLHPQAIAFENLDPLAGRPVRLDAGALEAKLVGSGRGGYCFEHNLLFMRVLEALGFHVRGLGARVLWGMPEGTVMPRTHMLLQIELDGATWLADVGFGGMTPTAPLRLELDIEQPTPHGPFRLVQLDEDILLQARVGSAWTPLYRFDLREQLLPDYEVANWYCSTSPASLFTTSLLAARPAPGCRYGLRNNELSIHRRDGPSERRRLRTPGEVRAVLTDCLGLAPGSLIGFDPVLERLTAVAA